LRILKPVFIVITLSPALVQNNFYIGYRTITCQPPLEHEPMQSGTMSGNMFNLERLDGNDMRGLFLRLHSATTGLGYMYLAVIVR
jgi:hypothetical protein